LNRLGKLWRQYDGAGLLTFEEYDFKGNVLDRMRQVIADAAILAAFTPKPAGWQVHAFAADWTSPPELDSTPYRTSVTYDALNRIKGLRYPRDVNGYRQELHPHYNRAGALERVDLGSTVYVKHIAYNARGQ